MAVRSLPPGDLPKNLRAWLAWSTAAGVLAFVTGQAVIVGWLFNVETLKSVVPGLATMTFNTAVCFGLAGVALLIRNRWNDGRSRLLARAAAAGIGVIALLTLAEYLGGADFGIDEAVVVDPESAELPGRMSIATAIAFLLTALSLELMDRGRFGASASPLLGLMTALIGSLGVTGYMFGAGSLDSFHVSSPMAVHTAALFVVIGLGIVAGRPESGFVSVLSSTYSGGRMARQVIPFVVAVPVVTAWLRLTGERLGISTAPMGTALFAIAAIVGLAAVVWLYAHDLNAVDAERIRDEQRLRLVVETAPSGMIVVDGQGRVTLVNREAERQFGYERGELVGRPVETLVPASARGGHETHRSRFMAAPEARAMGAGRDLYALRKDGSEFPVEIGLTPMTTPEGTFVVTTVIDITERKRTADELSAQRQDLLRSNADLEQFAYVASHDLQEPLRAMAGYLQILQRRYRGQLNEYADEIIGHAVDGAVRMQTLLHGVLSFSRVGRKGTLTTFSVDEVVDRALQDLDLPIRENSAIVTRDPLPNISGNPTELSLLFQNLLANAIKYRGEKPPRVHISAKRDTDSWIIAVKDNGIGIDPQFFDRIFVIFQRLHTPEEYPGTGLGLAICKKIVERHGGRIWIESSSGQGATFFFSLRADGTPKGVGRSPAGFGEA
jgi:PAS domain S-box-containing protein